MIPLFRRFKSFQNTVALLCVLGFATAWNATSNAQTSIPVEDFFKRPAISAAVLSPSGRYVAATMRGGAKNRDGLVILDMLDASKSKGIAAFADADITKVRWVNEDRLVFSVFDSKVAYADQKDGAGLFVVDRSGKDSPRNLIRRELDASESTGVTEVTSRLAEAGLSVFHRFYAVLQDGSSDVIVSRNNVDSDFKTLGTSLLRLNTLTGKAKLLTPDAPSYAFDWALDPQGNVRAAVSTRDGKSALHLRATPDAPWARVATWGRLADSKKELLPIAIDNKNQLYAATRQADSTDTMALASIDMASTTLVRKILLSLDGFDFDGNVNLRADGSILSVNYLSDAQSTHWFDADFKAAQAKIDDALKGRVNLLSCGSCTDAKRFLVASFSDQQPREWYYFDAVTNKLSLLEKSRPAIKAAMMATREMLRFPARDGLSIPVHITTPKGKGPFPTVVLVHGGPNVRGGEWGWNADSQFLASRGYLVIEPEFRGSTGFGAKHFEAGWKQWGLAMQDDLADAAQWAIKKGLSDPKRIAIAGASYGGYAAMMGLIKNPELFKVGVNWVGVSDIDLMYTARWSDTTRQWKDYGMPVLVGDRVKDREQFILTSPLKQAAKLTQPILMAYGDEDVRVPIAHGYAMRDALKKHNGNVEWITYKDEGHGWALESNNIDFWTRVAKFLDKNLAVQ